jgi:hypothetical protein
MPVDSLLAAAIPTRPICRRMDGPAVNETMRTRSGWQHAREITADVLIATALIWTLPLLLGAVVAVLSLL